MQKEQPLQYSIEKEPTDLRPIDTGLSKVLNDLLQPENNLYASEAELRKFKRKKKRKQHQSHN